MKLVAKLFIGSSIISLSLLFLLRRRKIMNLEDKGYIHKIFSNALYLFNFSNHISRIRAEHNQDEVIEKVRKAAEEVKAAHIVIAAEEKEALIEPKREELIEVEQIPASRFKGVQYVPENKNNHWKASIEFAGHEEFIGNYLTEEEAARAFNGMAKLYYGKGADLNDV